MTFWDSSALLPLVVEENRSSSCRTLRRTHPGIEFQILGGGRRNGGCLGGGGRKAGDLG